MEQKGECCKEWAVVAFVADNPRRYEAVKKKFGEKGLVEVVVDDNNKT